MVARFLFHFSFVVRVKCFEAMNRVSEEKTRKKKEIQNEKSVWTDRSGRIHKSRFSTRRVYFPVMRDGMRELSHF